MLKLILTACLLQSASEASAQPGQPFRRTVAEVKPLLIEAIDSSDGEAHGQLVGEVVDAIGRQFRTSSPVNVDVTTLVRYAQEGCRRLSVLIWQENVRLRPEAPGTRQSVEFGINYCRTGLPPQSLELARRP
jgi:hypothetical protein